MKVLKVKILSTILIAAIISIFISATALFIHYLFQKDSISVSLENTEEKVEEEYKLEDIKIMIYDFRNPSLGFTSASFNFVIQISNPLHYQIDSPRLVYEAYINGTHVAVGKTYLPDIPANGNRKYPASFIITYFDLGSSVVSAIKNGDLILNLKGKITSKDKEKKFDITKKY